MHMCQLFLVGFYFRLNMVAEHMVVTFGLKVRDVYDIQFAQVLENLESP